MITNTWLILGIFSVLASFSVWAAKYTKWGNYLGYVCAGTRSSTDI